MVPICQNLWGLVDESKRLGDEAAAILQNHENDQIETLRKTISAYAESLGALERKWTESLTTLKSGEKLFTPQYEALKVILKGNTTLPYSDSEYEIQDGVVVKLRINSPNLKNITPLLAMPTIRSLDIGRSEVSDLSALTNLHHLECLWLDYTQIEDLAPIINCQELTEIHLNSCDSLKNIDLVAGLPKLRKLTLYNTIVADLRFLARMSGLEELDIDGNNFQPELIADMSDLKVLRIFQAVLTPDQVERLIEILKQKTQIEQLWLPGVKLSSLGFIANMPGMKDLNIERTGIKDLSPLSALASLESINISENWIGNLDPLLNKPNLHTIAAQRNPLLRSRSRQEDFCRKLGHKVDFHTE